ncbi:MAG TPA: hypothetical protein VH299_06845 [Solirubrobacterales bacterium]|jgi:hypothetical protein|nr:hypothetical protein [Solirubrobacterales bacterium]
MVRQAHNYLVGALSGVTLIGIAIAVFVVLVSAQVFHDWPIAALSSHNDQSSVAPAKALPGVDQTADTAPTGTTARPAHPNAAKAGAATAAPAAKRTHRHHATSTDTTGPATVVEAAPTAAGDETSGGNSGSRSSQPSSSTNSSSSTPSSNSGSSSGGSSGSSSSSSSGSGSTATGSSGSTGGSGSTTTTPPTTAATKPLSEAVVETADGTVGAVNEVTGGTLEKAGVTQVTEEVVNGLAGPESLVGKTVNGVGETLNKVLGGGEG